MVVTSGRSVRTYLQVLLGIQPVKCVQILILNEKWKDLVSKMQRKVNQYIISVKSNGPRQSS